MIFLIISGPNGAGKTTIAKPLLVDTAIEEFINADHIAQGLSMLHPERIAFAAGRIALKRIDQLMEQKKDFAIETTLSSQSVIHLINKAKAKGYETVLHFYSLPNDDVAVKRVEHRVELGGHDIPKDVIRRRFHRGLINFFHKIQFQIDNWFFFNNLDKPELMAYQTKGQKIEVKDKKFTDFQKRYDEQNSHK